MKAGWIVAAVLVAAIGGGAAWYVKGSTGAPRVTYTTVPVERGSVVGRVTSTGTLSALVTVQVGAQVSGRIVSLGCDFNSTVKKGQVLAKLDPEFFLASIAQARANEQAAQGNLAKARAQAVDADLKLGRARQLAERKLIAQADLDAAEAEAAVAKATIMVSEGAVAQAQAARHQAEVNLAYTSITSPIDGTVISRAVDVGQTVAASLQTPTLFTIAENMARMQVDTTVAEADVGKLKEGQDTFFTVDAFPTRRFKGRIRQIRFAPQVVQNVVTYDAVIDVDNAELLLRPGMTANVTVIYARADNTLKVPNAALRFRLDVGEKKGRGGPELDAGVAARPPREAGADGGVGEAGGSGVAAAAPRRPAPSTCCARASRWRCRCRRASPTAPSPSCPAAS